MTRLRHSTFFCMCFCIHSTSWLCVYCCLEHNAWKIAEQRPQASPGARWWKPSCGPALQGSILYQIAVRKLRISPSPKSGFRPAANSRPPGPTVKVLSSLHSDLVQS